MDTETPLEISIKKEPSDTPGEEEEEARAGVAVAGSQDNSAPPATTTTPLRYVSRRGRPPGGGYSMKAPTHYVRFSSTPLNGGSSSSSSGTSDTTSAVSDLSPQRLMQLAGAPMTDSIELGRFGIHTGFDVEKNSFRCEGCDVVFSSRDTYAMHMLLRAKNESCVALPTSAISANPENPTPREKFERELRQKAMITALRNQAEAMSKAAAALLPKSLLQDTTLPPSPAPPVASPASTAAPSVKDECSRSSIRGSTAASNSFVGLAERSLGFNSLLALDAYGLYMDPSQYRRFLTEYGLRASSSAAAISNSALAAMMEQLACGVCGELFSNKDALAMHMMFHTREDGDGEEVRAKLRLREAWMSNASSFAGGNPSMMESSGISPPVSKSSSGHEINNHSTNDSGRGGKKREERQLTAERVAELKRMAIESSLRAPTTNPGGRSRASSTQRPRSVTTEDSTVTSTAQPRPLSADDATRLAMNSSSRGSFDLSNPIRSWSTDTRPYRKRHSSNKESYVSSARSSLSNQMSPRKLARWSHGKNTPSKHGSRSFKVCDNHVSSATGPQDSDENSESPTFNHGISQANESLSYGSDEGSDFYCRSGKGIPYLDAIMSHEAELVPVDGLENEKDSEDGDDVDNRRRQQLTSDDGTDSAVGNHAETSSAIDFSLGAQKKGDSNNTSGRERWGGDHDGLSFGLNSSNSSDLYSRFRNGSSFNNHNINNNNNSNNDNSIGNDGDVQRRPGSPRFIHNTATTFSSPAATPATGAPSLDALTPAPPSRVGEARYCPHCEILFLDVTLFHLHMGLHNVNNPWQCNTCGLACSGRLEFNTHVLHY